MLLAFDAGGLGFELIIIIIIEGFELVIYNIYIIIIKRRSGINPIPPTVKDRTKKKRKVKKEKQSKKIYY